MPKKDVYIYDLEVYPNYFYVLFKKRNEKTYVDFELFEDDKDNGDIAKFVKSVVLIGYNNIGYDAQILEFIIKNPGCTAYDIKRFNDQVIEAEWPPFKESKLSTTNLDMMLVNNYGARSAKSTSLKKIEFFMRQKSIKDTPIHFNTSIKVTQKKLVKDYCKSDVDKTEDFINATFQLVKPRIELTKLTKINFLNSTEPQMAKKWFVHKLKDVLGMPEDDIKSLRTYRKSIIIKNIILPKIKFKSQEFQDAKQQFENIVLYPKADGKINLKGQIEFSKIYKNEKFDFGAGGLHQSTSSGIYTNEQECVKYNCKYKILDFDFSSYYPNLAIKNNFYPKHLGPEFLKIYEQLYIERQTLYPKKTHPHLNYLWKIFLNSTYGLSNSEYGLFYDAQYTAQTCINGQLFLAMLVEYIAELIPDIKILQTNTDGVTFMLPEIYEERIHTLVKKYEAYVNIPIEYVEYKKMIITDVNNYLVEDINGNIKAKGLYETYDDMLANLAFHKDCSANIIPVALREYFIKNIPVEDTVNNWNIIHDFTIGVKGKSNFRWLLSEVKDKMVKNEFIDTRLIRYYAGGTTTLSKMWKISKKRTQESFTSVEATTPVVICQNLRREDIVRKGVNAYPDLDRSWYIDKINKIIENVR